jgi:cytoskeletal protein CcmA (bactofilin family)
MRIIAGISRRYAFLATALAMFWTPGAVELVQAQVAPATAGVTSSTANRNVYAAGGQVRPSGQVQGDYTAAGGKVIVDHAVGGDVSLAGGSVDVRAPVSDDVRAVGGDVSIESTVGGELFAAGGNVSLTPAAAIARGATLYGSSVGVDGRVGGDLKATAQKVTINGEVRGNARVVAEDIELGPQARIGGALSYSSRSELKKAEGATIAGGVTRDVEVTGREGRRGPEGTWSWDGSARGGASWVGTFMSFLALLAFAAIFLLLLPRFGEQASDRIRATPWLALALGFASLVAVPILALLLFVTLLGIPLAIAVMALYPALMLAGFVVAVLFIARLLQAALRQAAPQTFPKIMGYFGAALLMTLLVAKVPFVGGLVVGLLGLAGVGGCVLELYGRRRHGPPGTVAAERPVMAVSAEAR